MTAPIINKEAKIKTTFIGSIAENPKYRLCLLKNIKLNIAMPIAGISKTIPMMAQYIASEYMLIS